MFDSCLSESIAGGVRGNFNDLLKEDFVNDWRIRLADLGVASDIYPDGWVGPSAQLVVQAAPKFAEHLVLSCRTGGASKRFQTLRVATDAKTICEIAGVLPERFSLRVPLRECLGRTQGVLIHAASTFVPASTGAGSSADTRQLAFQILDVRFE